MHDTATHRKSPKYIRKWVSNKCASRLARRIPHHTALSNAVPAVPNAHRASPYYMSNSPCVRPVTVVCRLFPAGQIRIHPGSNAAPVNPREPMFTKGDKTCPDSRPTHMQNFTALPFSAAKKYVIVKKKQYYSKLKYPPILPYRMVGGN